MALRISEEHGLTDVGRQRKTNEDSYFESSPVFAVADGMGGARAGEVASRIAVEAFEGTRDQGESHEAQLAAIARTANHRIHELAHVDESRAGMGTTLTAVMVGDSDVAVGHVGDSRAYRFRDETLERLTNDHSLVEEMVRKGQLTPEEAEVHPQRSIITRALGPEPEVEVETFSTPGRDGDVYLLCSDGLTGMVSESAMGEVLHEHHTLAEAAERLVNLANANGGRDNITVVLFRLGEDTAGTSEEDTGEIDARAVAAGVAAEGESGRGAPSTSAGPEGQTFLLDAETAERERGAEGASRRGDTAEGPVVAEDRPAAEGRPGARKGPSTRRPHPSRGQRRRRLRTAALTLLGVAVLALGAVAGARQLFFLGTNDQGLVTLYRGLPYEGPFGLRFYEEQYASAVPAASIRPLQRDRVLDHELRPRQDAADLIRRLERARAPSR
ncbi:MAG: Stp1/IreP family PP2C-type Ser/Thr phosphatase [Thermoleophilaceae bacterium]